MGSGPQHPFRAITPLLRRTTKSVFKLSMSPLPVNEAAPWVAKPQWLHAPLGTTFVAPAAEVETQARPPLPFADIDIEPTTPAFAPKNPPVLNASVDPLF